MKSLYKALIVGMLILPTLSFATPISWDFAGGILQPLQSAWNAVIRGSYFTATSTSQSSTFPRFTGTYGTTTNATSTNLFSTNGNFTNLTIGTLSGSLYANSGVVGATATGSLTESVSGLEFDATRGLLGGSAVLSLSSGFSIPLTASTTNWNTFYDTPSTRITAGANCLWTGNTFNCSGGGGGSGGGWATTTDNNPEVGETVTYTSNDAYIGGSSSSTAEFNFDKDSATFTVGNPSSVATGSIYVRSGGLNIGSSTGEQAELNFNTNNVLNLFSSTGITHFNLGSIVASSTYASSSRLSLYGSLFDRTSSAGTNGQVLQSNGSGVAWVSTSTLGLGGAGGGTVTSVDMTVPTGLSISGNPITTSGTLALTYAGGYAGVLTASTSNWNSFFDTPSTRISAGDALTWSSNTLNFDGGNTPSGDLGGTWSSPSVTDDSHAHTGTTLSGIDISDDTNLSADGTEIILTGDALSLGNTLSFTNFTATNGTTTNASSTNLFATNASTSVLTVGNTLRLFGGSVTTNNALCIQLTGDAGLCDGNDASGGGGGSISTSSIPVAGNLTYWTSPSTLSDVATGTLTETVTGLNLSATRGLVGGSAILQVDAGFSLASTSDFIRINTAFASSTAINATAPLTYTGTTGNLSISLANSSTDGYLSSTDWTSFNQKVSSTSIDTLTELETLQGGINIIQSTEIDTSSELATLITDEVGTGSLVFNGSPSFTGTIGFVNATSSGSSTIQNLTVTNGTTTNATTTNLRVGNSLSFNGVTGTTWATFCTSITGSASLCDGDDATGGGGGGEASDWQLGGTGYIVPTTTVGISVSASSTIGNGTATGGLTVSGNSTTTGNAWFDGSIQSDSEFELVPSPGNSAGVNGSLQLSRLTDEARIDLFGGTGIEATIRTSSVSTEFYGADGSSYFSLLADQGASGFQISDTNTNIQLNAGNHSFVNTAFNFGIGSSTPSRKLTVAGDAIFANTYATGTASSTNLLATNGTTTNATSTNLATTIFKLATDVISDITGFGLAIVNGALGIDTTGATDGECLKYVSAGPAISWDTCGGGGSSKWTDGTNFTYLTNTTYDLAFGSSATATAPFWWDVSATTSYIGNGGAGDSVLTFGPTGSEWTMGFDDTDDAFALSTSTSLGTSDILRVATSGVFTLKATSDPASPSSGNVAFYMKSIAGRILPKIKGPSGIDTALQTALFQNGIRMVIPESGTTIRTWGMPTTNVGTVSHPTLASTNLLTSTSRFRLASASTANSASERRSAQTTVWFGNASGLGGFFYNTRFAFSTAVANQRSFIGFLSVTTAISTTQDPATLTNMIGIGNSSASTTLSIMYNDGSGNATSEDLGSNFPSNSTSAFYDFTMFSAPNSSVVQWRVIRLDTGATVEGSYSTNIPSNTTFLAPHEYMNNGGTASAVQLDIARVYIETDT